MATLHLNLTLELGKVYLDDKGHKVTLVREFTKNDADYVQGFRFRGDNGVNYLGNGTVVGHLGDLVKVKQPGAYDLREEHVEKSEEPIFATIDDAFPHHIAHPLSLEEGQFYRNGLGQPVLIIGKPIEGSHWWKKGYRFIDQRGTFYKPNGSVDSWPWGVLDLVMQVTADTPLSEQVTDAESVKIMADVGKRIAAMNGVVFNIDLKKAMQSTYRFCKKSLFGLGVANTAVGATLIRTNTKLGIFNFVAAGASFLADRYFPDELK